MRSSPLLRSASALLFGALLLTACGGSGDSGKSGETGNARDGAPSGQAAGTGPDSGAFPAVVDSGGTKVTIASAPKRIVSLTPSATEMLFAIGAGDQVTAVDDQSDFPAQAPKTKLSGFKPNIEAITNYNPDLVVASDDVDGLVKSLTGLKVPVVLTPAARTLEDTYTQINTLGAATGHAKAAGEVVERMRTEIAGVVANTPKPAEPLSYFHELDSSLYTATSETFMGQVYSLFGLRNIADPADAAKSGYPQLSPEYLVESDPDLVFLADTKCCGQNADTVAARPGWDQVTAVRDGGVVALDDDVASRWGPRVVDLVKAVSAAVTKAGAAQR